MNTRKEVQPWRYFGITAAVFSLWLPKLKVFGSSEGMAGIVLGTVFLNIVHRTGLKLRVCGKIPRIQGTWMEKGTAACRLLWYLAVFLILTGSSAAFIRDCFWNGMSVWMAWGLLLLMLLPAAGKKREVWQRITAVSAPWLCLLTVGILILSVRQADTAWLTVTGLQPAEVLKATGIYLAGSWYQLLLPGTGKKGMWPDSKEGLYLLQGIFSAGLCLLFMSVYGGRGTAYRRWPVLSLLQGISVPGRFLERVDAVWAAAFLFAVFLAAGLLLQKMDACLQVLGVGKRKRQLWKWKDLVAFGLLVLVFFVYRYRGVEAQNRAFVSGVLADLEDDGYVFWFPLQTGGEITKLTASDFTEARKLFLESQDLQPDFGHTEVTILGEKLLENREMTDRLFKELAGWQEMDENSYVFCTENPESLLEAETKENSIGSYISGLYENRFGPAREYLTLQRLLVRWENGIYDTQLPELVNQADTLWISFSCKTGQGSIQCLEQ